MSRCTGHCCEAFDLSAQWQTHWDLINAAWRWLDLRLGKAPAHAEVACSVLAKHLPPGYGNLNQLDELAYMVIPLGRLPDDDIAARFTPACRTRMSKADPLPQHWTCRYFDREERRCTNYENRPNMCRRFPYGGACPYSDCTMSADDPGYAFEGEKGPIRVEAGEVKLDAEACA